MVNQDLTAEQKAQIKNTIMQMVDDGASEEDILAYKEEAMSAASQEVVKTEPVEDQTDAPVQETEEVATIESDSASEEPSSDFQLNDEQKSVIKENIMGLVANGASDEQIKEYKRRAIDKFENPPTQEEIETEKIANIEEHETMLKSYKMDNLKNSKLDDLEQKLRGQKYDQANQIIGELNELGYELPEVSFEDPKNEVFRGEGLEALRKKPSTELKLDDIELDQRSKETQAAVDIMKSVWRNKWKFASPTGYLQAITDPNVFSNEELTADNDGLLNLSEYSNMTSEERDQWDKDFQEGKVELTPWESSLRSLEQNANRLATIDDRVLTSVGLVMSNTDSDILRQAGSAMISVGKEQQDRADDISGATIGFTDIPEREDYITASLAAMFGSTLNVGTSVLESSVPGLLAVDMISQSVYDYNKAKADELGISLEELAQTGGVETTSALVLGAASFGLERIGIKGIRNYINSMPTGSKQALLSLLSTSGNEATTELLQYYTETFNTSVAKHRAQGLSQEEAMTKAGEEVGNNLTSKEAIESALQGAFGGGAIGVGGRLRRRRSNPNVVNRSEENSERLNDATEQVRELEDMKHQRSFSKEEIDQVTAAQEIAEQKKKEISEEPYLELASIPKENLQEVLAINDTITELHEKAVAVESSENYTPEEKASLIASYDTQIEELTTKAFDIVQKGQGKDKTKAPEGESPIKTVVDKINLDEEQLETEKKFTETKDDLINSEVENFAEPMSTVYEGAIDKFGVEILPAQGTLRKGTQDKLMPLTKDGAEFSKGDFVKTVDSTRPMDKAEAGRAKKYIDNQAKRNGYVSQVKVIKNDDGTFGIKGAIKSPKRDGNINTIVKEEIAPVEEVQEATTETAERKPVDAALEYAQSETKDAGKGAYEGEAPTEIQDGILYPLLTDPKEFKKAGVYSTIGRLKKSGFPNAKYEITEEGVTVIPGEFKEEAKRGELSLTEKPEAANEIARVQALPEDAEDGATFNLDGSNYNDGGLVVPLASKNVKVSELSPESIQEFVDENQEAIGDSGIVKAGIYKFPNSDNASIDLNIVVPSQNKEAALQFGKYLGQESLFDLETFENVKTGEDGQNPLNLTPAQFREATAALEKGEVPSFAKGELSLIEKKEEREGALSKEDLVSEGINPLVDLQEGQSYIKIPLHQAAGESAGLAGGKGGFGSQGDAREAVGQVSAGQATQSAADFQRLIQDLYTTSPEVMTDAQRNNALEIIRNIAKEKRVVDTGKATRPTSLTGEKVAGKFTEAGVASNPLGNVGYGILKGMSNSIKNRESLTPRTLEEINETFDKFMGYEGAHKNLDRKFRIGVANDLNLPLKKDGPKRTEEVKPLSKDEIVFKGGSRTVDLRLETKDPSQKNEVRSAVAEPYQKKDILRGIGKARTIEEIETQEERIKGRIKDLDGLINDAIENNEDPNPKWTETKSKLENKLKELASEKNSPQQDLSRQLVGTELTEDVVSKWIEDPEANAADSIKNSLKFAFAVAKKAQRGDSYKLDDNLQQIASGVVSEAFNSGKVGNQEFNPTNLTEAKKKLGGMVRDAVRNYYLTDGSIAGVTGRNAKSNARLNKIRKAAEYLSKLEGPPVQGSVKVGGASMRIDATDFGRVAEILNEGFKVRGKLIQDETITPEKAMEVIARENQIVNIEDVSADLDGDPIMSFFTESLGYVRKADRRTAGKEALRSALESVGRRKGNKIAKSLGLPEATITSLVDKIGAVAAEPQLVLDPNTVDKLTTDQKRSIQYHINKNEDTRLRKISQLVESEVDSKWLKNNYVKVANAMSDKGADLAQFFKTEFIENQNNRAKPARDFKNFVSNFLAAELEGSAVRSPKTKRRMSGNPLGELSLNEHHVDFLDIVETKGDPKNNDPWTSERVSREIIPDIIASVEKNKGRLDGNNFILINTGKSPNKKVEILKLTENFPEAFGAKVVMHPNNPGRMIIGNANGEFSSTIEDLVDHLDRGDKLIDVDFRDFKNIHNGLENFVKQYKGLIKNNRFGAIRALKAPGQIKYVQTMLLSNGFYPKYPKVDGKGYTTIEFVQHKKPRISEASLKEFNPLRKADQKYLDKMTEVLNKNWKGVNVVSDPDSVVRAAELLGVTAGEMKGAYLIGENTVVLNPNLVTYDTPIHEFAHIWSKRVLQENAPLWRHGAGLLTGAKFDADGKYIKGSVDPNANKFTQAVYKNPVYRQYLEEGNVGKFIEEVMANSIGKHGAEITQDKVAANAWDAFMQRFSDAVKKLFNIASSKNFSDLKLNDFLDIGVEGSLTGKVPTPAQNSEVEANLLEESEEQSKSTLQNSIENDIARKNSSKRGIRQKLSDILTPPGSDDFRGLIQRANKKTNQFSSKMKDLLDTFVKENDNYVNASSAARNSYKSMVNNLKESLKKSGLEKMDEPSKSLTYGGDPISISQAIGVYMNTSKIQEGGDLTAKELKAIKNKIENNPALLNFVGNIRINPMFRGMEWKVGLGVNAQIINFIEKGLKKRELSGFIAKKKEFQKKDMNKVHKELGQKFGDAFDDALNRMSGFDGMGSDPMTEPWNRWATGAIGATMFVNLKSAAFQMLSSLNYMTETNPIKFASKFANMPQLAADAKMLWNDPFLKERRARAGFDVNAEEFATTLQSGDLGEFTRKLLTKGFIATSTIDSSAIAVGGAAYYRTLRDQGNSHEEAIKKWRETSEESQQSSRADWVSQQQKSGASKYILAFANTPMQYFRLSQKAWRTVNDKNATGAEKAQAVSKIGYYMIAQNAVFSSLQAMSDALFSGWYGDDDEVEEARGVLNSMTNSVLRGMGFTGAVINALKEAAYRSWKEGKKTNPNYSMALLKGGLEISPPLSKKVKDVIAIGDAFKYDKDETGIRSPWATAAAKGTVTLTNLPADWLQKKMIATQNLMEDDYTKLQSSLMVLGYGEWNFRNSKKNESSDLDLDLDIDLDDIDLDYDLD